MTRPAHPRRVSSAMTTRFTLLPAALALLTACPASPQPAGGFAITAGDRTAYAATIEAALATARTRHGNGAVTITFPAGLVRLSAPIALDARDAGTVLRAAPEGTTLSGAVVIAPAGASRLDDPALGALPGFKVGDPAPPATPQLFTGGERQRPASWPAQGYRTGWRVEQTAAGALLHPVGAPLPASEGPVLVSGYFGPGWAWDAIPARVTGGGLLLARTPEFGFADTARLRVSGALPLAPGRYAPDAGGARLALTTGPIELARTPMLLTLAGTRDVRIEGLAFERSVGTAIRIDDSSDVRLADCRIRQTGDRAVEIAGGHGVTIDRCRISETGGSAIFVSAGRRAELAPSGDAITATTVTHWGQALPTAPGVVVWGVGTSVRGNRIAGGGGGAIQLQGNDHRVEGNEIAWAVCEAEDAGAVYLGRDWTGRGTVIAGNYLHDIGDARDAQIAGVYLDDLASGTDVSRNTFVRIPFGVILGGGRDNAIDANLFAALVKAAVMFDARGTTWAKALTEPGGALRERLAAMPYRSPLWRARYPQLAALPEDRPAEPVGNVMTRNARIDTQPVWALTPGYTLAVEGDRLLQPTRAERDVLDGADRERAWPVLARLGGLDADAPWRSVPPTGVTACPR